MNQSLYQDIIIDHYRHPRQYGSLKKPTNKVDASNPLCGDMLHLEITVSEGILKEIAYTGQGCAISQASASILYEDVIGKKIEEVEKIDKNYLLKKLGIELSPNRLKCALLSVEALKKALILSKK